MKDHRCRAIIIILLFTFIFQISTVLRAQETITREPILITSERVEYLEKKKIGEFSGNVKVTQGKLTLTCTKLKVIFDERGERMKQILATGSVKMVRDDLTATSESATFHNEEQMVVLAGKPQVFWRDNRFSGEKITIYLKEDRLVIDTKVKGIIVPEK